MVMKKNAMRRNLRQSIVKSFGRYVAIAAIIALGAGLFMGLLMSKEDMVATGQKFIREQNMFDLRMVSNYGWSEKYVEAFSELDGVTDVEGLIYLDLIARTGDAETDSVYRFYSIPERVNKVALRGGRMPESAEECLADGYFCDDSILGKTVTISRINEEDSLEALRYQTFTIVGYVATPLYMDMNRGTTSVGSGSLENYYYVPADAFDVDYYTEINLTLENGYGIYSDEYNDFLEDTIDRIEPEAETLSQQRFLDVKGEAEEEYDEGYQEYLDGVKEYEEGKAEAEQELADAYQELKDAEEELEDNRKKLVNAGNQIEQGKKDIDAASAELHATLRECESNLEEVRSGLAQARAGVAAIEAAANMSGDQIKANYSAVSQGLQEANSNAADVAAMIDQAKAAETPDEAQIAALEQQLAVVQATAAELQVKYDMLLPLYNNYVSAAGMVSQLEGQEIQLQNAIVQINQGFEQIAAQLDQLTSIEAQLMVNWGKWGEGRDEIAEGWIEYEDAKLEVKEELEEAEAELKDAEEELRDAREEIDSMEAPDLIILDRNSNVGYNNLDSSSSIVAGVSRVIPVFFLLVASLVCITTMTRMIDEERTQIGTLKALGYTNREIMNKYLVYSGSGAILGCTLGLILGCTVIPQIIWAAYKIMLYIQPDVVLTVNWPLAVAIVVVYTALMLLVTWYSCRKTLQEEPAELIRPKSPEAGKKILMEYLPFWKRISFLNKVTIRNIFRYRQRMAMMLIGISGCTALLLTGFGLRDSIVNVADFQFRDITKYDLSVYFQEEPTQEDAEEFLETVQGMAENTMFYHQSSVELAFAGRVKELYMISGDEKLAEFIDLHKGDAPLALPGAGEVVLSIGVAENMGIGVGDTLVLRNADLQEMELRVSAIYDNYVYNYALVSPETIASYWGSVPEQQMAFVKVNQSEKVHAVSAAITELDSVLNVSVSKDLADMVGSMMDALDLVVLLIVFSAGLLAVVVLYNLTNININERIREIATIKVLGFRASETGAYVFKENLVLTVVGSLLGLVLGRLLLAFVISQVKIDMVWFKAVAEPASYGISIVLTLLSAIIVDFIFYFKLEKINMAEALKSVE